MSVADTPAKLPPYTVREAAAVLGITPKTARKLIKAGTFPAPTFTVGSLVKVARGALDAYVTGEAR